MLQKPVIIADQEVLPHIR